MICPKCGYDNQEGYTYCLKCGTALNVQPVSPLIYNSPAPKPKEPLLLPELIVSCVSILFQFIAIIYRIVYLVKYTNFYNVASLFNSLFLFVPPIVILLMVVLRKFTDKGIVLACGAYYAFYMTFEFFSGYYYIVDDFLPINATEYFIMFLFLLGITVLTVLSQFTKSKPLLVADIIMVWSFILVCYVIFVINMIFDIWNSFFWNLFLQAVKTVMASLITLALLRQIKAFPKKEIPQYTYY